MNESVPLRTESSEEAAERSLKDDLRQLALDARALADAEVSYQKSRAAFAGRETKWIAVLGVVAAVFAFFALVALTVGLVIALTPLLTAWGATAAVFGGLLGVALVCGLIAARRWSHMRETLAEKKAG